MKKNRMMRLASGLLVAVLLTTSVISGTFAKYTTSVSGTDSARVAQWGFEPVALDISGLFEDAYTINNGSWTTHSVVSAVSEADVIAPGTTGSATFAFAYDESAGIAAPEVAYSFAISTDGSEIDDAIKNNKNIKWKVDDGAWGTWDQMIAAVKALSGNESGVAYYEANTLPAGFGVGDPTHTIGWVWTFDGGSETYDHDNNGATPALNQDEYDTWMGNADTLDNVSITITITATQID